MKEFPSLKNQLLVAMPSLHDSYFDKSVMLMCEHNEEGALGIMVNHPLDFSTTELLEHMDITHHQSLNLNPVLSGGPVQSDRGFVIHRASPEKNYWESSIQLDNDVNITTSTDILHAIARDEVDQDTFIALGYAGWEAGQLEQELIENSWLTVPMVPEIIFDIEINERWQMAVESLNIDISQLSQFTGNA
jgi:putative transcriptional regulator